MTREEMKELNLTPIEDYITEDYGEEGTPTRMEFEARVDAFILGERLKEERLKAGLTQEQLASKIGTKKSYISRVENGHADIQVSTLFKIFQGLGRRVSLTIL
ncbi:MAG: helix-turn-helix domain-containing protein [Bacteroidaceae bacterium]|nr:helix-turn-helix domain-containing protein [Bacteroidaceae bacterium]